MKEETEKAKKAGNPQAHALAHRHLEIRMRGQQVAGDRAGRKSKCHAALVSFSLVPFSHGAHPNHHTASERVAWPAASTRSGPNRVPRDGGYGGCEDPDYRKPDSVNSLEPKRTSVSVVARWEHTDVNRSRRISGHIDIHDQGKGKKGNTSSQPSRHRFV